MLGPGEDPYKHGDVLPVGVGAKGSVASAARTRCGVMVPGMLLWTRWDLRDPLCLGDLPTSVVRHEKMPVIAAVSLVFSVITVCDQPQNISHGR